MEGCLIACWLALRDDAEGVEYRPGEKAYLIKGDGVGDWRGFGRMLIWELGSEGRGQSSFTGWRELRA